MFDHHTFPSLLWVSIFLLETIKVAIYRLLVSINTMGYLYSHLMLGSTVTLVGSDFRPLQGLSIFSLDSRVRMAYPQECFHPHKGLSNFLFSWGKYLVCIQIIHVSVPIRGYLISYPVSVTLVFMHPDYLPCGAKFISL